MSNTKRLVEGKWEDAIPEPYYPSFIERVLHRFGFHIYAYPDTGEKCLFPKCKRKLNKQA